VNAKYTALLSGEVRQVEMARQMQVAFKKQVQVWKDILIRGQNPEDLEKYTKEFYHHEELTVQLAERLKAEIRQPEIRGKVEQFIAAHKDLAAKYRQGLEIFQQSKGTQTHKVDTLLKGQDRPPTDLIDTIVGDLQKDESALAESEEKSIADHRRAAFALIAILFAALSAGSIYFAK